MTLENTMNGFNSTYIYPFIKNIFTDADFLSSLVTDRQAYDLQKEDTSNAHKMPWLKYEISSMREKNYLIFLETILLLLSALIHLIQRKLGNVN